MSELETLFHEAFVAWTTRHREELDEWAKQELLRIAELAEFHRRSIGQYVRHARVRLWAAADALMPEPNDPDYVLIVKAKQRLAMARRVEFDEILGPRPSLSLFLMETP